MQLIKKNHEKYPKEHGLDSLSSQEYNDVYKSLSEKKKPSATLRYLMNKFEDYRQKRKIGWSRPQNKKNINTFESYYMRPHNDTQIIKSMKNMVNETKILADMPCMDSLLEILADPGLMGFLFVQDYDDGDTQKEVLTLSLGRKYKANRRYRDRVDFLFESKILQGNSQGLTSFKIYVDPFDPLRLTEPLWHTYLDAPLSATVHKSFEKLVSYYQVIKQDESRWWKHWTQDYIDYFGPRKKIIRNSFVDENSINT